MECEYSHEVLRHDIPAEQEGEADGGRRLPLPFGGHKRFLKEQMRKRPPKPATDEAYRRCFGGEHMISKKPRLPAVAGLPQ